MFFNQTFGMWNKTLKIEVICTHRHRASRIKERTLAFRDELRPVEIDRDSQFAILSFLKSGCISGRKRAWFGNLNTPFGPCTVRCVRIGFTQTKVQFISTVYKHSRKSRLFASSWFTLTSRRKVKLNVGDDRILRMDSVGLGSFKIEIRNSWNWICGRYFKRNLL